MRPNRPVLREADPIDDDLDADARRQRANAVIDRLQAALLAHDMDAFADEWAADGTMTFPFAPPGWPRLSGREEVRDYLAGYTDIVDVRGVSHQTRHETTDPDTIIVEWGVSGIAHATGRAYDIDYVAFVTVGADGIVAYRDYWNALAAGAALGSVDEMIAAFTDAGPK
ncbi:nuclear transport factor 2 family protein [Mycobacterium sp. OAE908]|uniref:nuclear transport factor 2 family protein n=1 Tax=Mycobacterium sp. OAE908 TaxID=2817899 RepID=UPI001AE2B178